MFKYAIIPIIPNHNSSPPFLTTAGRATVFEAGRLISLSYASLCGLVPHATRLAATLPYCHCIQLWNAHSDLRQMPPSTHCVALSKAVLAELVHDVSCGEQGKSLTHYLTCLALPTRFTYDVLKTSVRYQGSVK